MLVFKIDSKTTQALKMIEFLKTLPFIEILDTPNEDTQKAIEDARNGKVKKAKNVESLFKSLKK